MNTSTLNGSPAGTDWGQLLMLGNDIAMQWYAMAHDTTVPQPQYIPGTPIPTQVYSDTSRLMIVGLVVVAVIILARK